MLQDCKADRPDAIRRNLDAGRGMEDIGHMVLQIDLGAFQAN